MENYTIFDFLYPKYKIEKPIRLIELFSGYGSQALALKYLGVRFEHWRISEWATKSIQAYNDLHIQDYEDYSKEYTDEEIIDLLLEYGISINYNNPATKEQIKRQKYRRIYNNIKATNNLVNIQNVKGEDLKIENTEEYEYIMTYSFPCQDLSLAGKRKGMKDTSTRSGMLWEVERILKECSRIGALPQILLMENVPQVHGSENVKYFNDWQYELEKLGYKNYFEDLIATDYGIPQTRNRCFMISILGEYNYTFPKPIPLKLKLKDMLEKEVDEKYFLDENLISHIKKTAIDCGEYIQYDRYNGDLEMWCRVWKEKSPTLNTKCQETKILLDNLRIRKLTPKECFRLMGVKDEDFEKVRKNQSESSLYHLAGDSIVVNVLMAIFKELL